MAYDEKLSLDDIIKTKVQPDPQWEREELTLEEHRDIHEWNPGHKFAHKFKKSKNKDNGGSAYGAFVREMVVKERRRLVPHLDFSRYGPKWDRMSEVARLPYKEKAAKDKGSQVKTISWQLEERRDSDMMRKTFGVSSLGFNQLVRLYYPPPTSELRPTRGRENLLDLETLIALYEVEEHEDILWEAKLLDDAKKYFPSKEAFCHKPIVFIGIIPASKHPNPHRSIFRPLEIYLAVATLSEGLSDEAYHVFVDLNTTLIENPHDDSAWPFAFGVYEDRIRPAMKEAWDQAFFRHNIPFVPTPFESATTALGAHLTHLNKHYNGWDTHARKKLPFNKSYAEIYETMVEFGRDASKNDEEILFFTKLEDVEMVDRCLKWLHEQAVMKLGTKNVVEAAPKVSSLEHLAWHAGSVLGMAPTEKVIEEALAENTRTEDLQLKCGFHQSKPSSFICARAATLANVFNAFTLLLPAFQVPPTKNHFPYGDTDIRMPWSDAFGRAEAEKSQKTKKVKEQSSNLAST